MSDAYRLFQRGRTWWVDYHDTTGTRHRVSTGTRIEADARQAAADIIARLSQGVTSQWTLGEAVKRTTASRWAGTPGESTAVFNAGQAVTYFGAGCSVGDITTARLDEYADWLAARGNSGATVNRKMAALSAVLRTAMDRGHLSRMPKLPRSRESSGRIRWLTDAEEVALLSLLEQWSYPAEVRLVAFLVDTGCRLGEALRLEWRDVNEGSSPPAAAQVHLWQTKSNVPRTVPLTKRAAAALQAQRKDDTAGPFKGRITKHGFRHIWDRARHHLGHGEDAQFVPHALRHTCASRLVQRGVPLAVVQAMLGHTVIQTTMRYAHLAPANLAAAVAALEPAVPAQLRRVK